MADIVLSEHQQEAVTKAVTWYGKDPERRRPWFRLDGGAGTGKTTSIQAIVRAICERYGIEQRQVHYVAPTGKSAMVMGSKGCPNPTTIHKKIYNPSGSKGAEQRELDEVKSLIREREAIIELGAELDAGDGSSDKLHAALSSDPQLIQLKAQLDKLESINKPLWAIKEDSQLTGAKLLVLSEASMVDDRVALDLLNFKVPILLEGDPHQLPPIAGQAYFMKGKADHTLTEIRRQEHGSPIIEMARLARMGSKLRLGDYGQGCSVVSKLPLELALQADQIIVGRNKTRHTKNDKMRVARGFLATSGRAADDWYVPRTGEKLICLRNDNDLGIMNGQLFTAGDCNVESDSKLQLAVTDEDTGDNFTVRCHSELFKGNSQRPLPAFALRAKGVQQFDYGYVITCHKAQGSQWPFVVVYDQSRQFPDWRAWLYTALTRAAKRLIVVNCGDDE